MKKTTKYHKPSLLILLIIIGLIAAGFLVFSFIKACRLSDNGDSLSHTAAAAEETDDSKHVDSSSETIPEIENSEFQQYAEQMKVDADAYFKENGDVYSVTEVNSSEAVETESEAIKNMSNRGFTQNPVLAEFTMDGEYAENLEASESSMTEHPYYVTLYTADNGDIWQVFAINGFIMANPLSYNMSLSEADEPAVVSESWRIMSYDNVSGQFYESLPHHVSITVVNRIDADTLNRLSAEELGSR